MKNLLLGICLLAGMPVAVAAADPATELREAINHLGQKSNYTWVTIPKSQGANFNPAPTEGKTEKNGFTFLRIGQGPNAVEAAFYGNRSAIKAEDRWESADELPVDRSAIARRLRSFRTPAAEAQDLLFKTGKITKSSGAYNAELTSAGVRDLLLARRTGATLTSEPVATRGSVKFWIKDGLLTKYEYHLEGRLVASQQARIVDVNLTTTVEIKDVGMTQVQVPEEARKKLM